MLYTGHRQRSNALVAGLAFACLVFSPHALAQSAGYWQQERVESGLDDGTKRSHDDPCFGITRTGGQNEATFSSKLVCGNSAGTWSGSATGTWSNPPTVLIPGNKVEMSISARARATHSGRGMSMGLLVDFNRVGCGATNGKILIVEGIAYAHYAPLQSIQKTGTAVVPDEIGRDGRLLLRVCTNSGWQALYWYKWVPGPSGGPTASTGATGSGSQTHNGQQGADSHTGPDGSVPAPGGWTFSRWTSITPDQRQSAAQPGGTMALPVLTSGGGQAVAFKPGQYVVFYAFSDPDGRSISRWERAGPFTLNGGDKWKATSYGPLAFRMERNSADLMQYATPGPGAAMIYARNNDVSHWRSICVLPVGSGMTVGTHCFRGSNVVRVSPDATGDINETPPGFTGATVSLFSNANDGAVGNGPTRPTVLNFTRPTLVTKLTTYHWNNGRGTPNAGTIALRSSSGGMYGPWPATGQPGSGGAPNAYWVVTTNTELPAGTYTVVDSDPSTWAQNGQSGGAGLAWIDGKRQ